jgi:hypothetical protein
VAISRLSRRVDEPVRTRESFSVSRSRRMKVSHPGTFWGLAAIREAAVERFRDPRQVGGGQGEEPLVLEIQVEEPAAVDPFRQPIRDLLVEKPGLARPAHPDHHVHLARQGWKREAPA